jgi:hypothetical protein
MAAAKIKIIERRSIKGAYGMPCDMAILDDDRHGRLLVAQGWGGSGVQGETHRWCHGVVVKLKPTDNFEALDADWNDCFSTMSAVLSGADHFRPMLEWSGHAVAAYAQKHLS